MTILRVIVEDMLGQSPSGLARYTEELTRAIIDMAPPDCTVEGIVAASPEPEYARIEKALPGLTRLYKTALARRELQTAWQHGFTRLPGQGMVHAPSLFAPLSRRDRLNNLGTQTVVTIHDAAAWTHPELLPAKAVAAQKAMAKRAQRYADAIVVPSHAVADQIDEILDVRDRIRIIGGAASPRVALPLDAASRADALGLPERYVLTTGGLAGVSRIEDVVRATALTDGRLPLVIIGVEPGAELAAVVAEAGLAPDQVIALGSLLDSDLAVAITRSEAYVYANAGAGFGLAMLEAMALGAAVVHTDSAALAEVAVDSGVPVEDGPGFVEALAAAIDTVADDPELAARLRIQAVDRSHAFSWRTSAEKVWQLHADL